MPVITVPAGVTSRPHFVPAGSIVKVSPAAGASAVVEYTATPPVGVANGTATWLPWSKGAVTSEATNRANNPLSVRVTAIGGEATLDLDHSPGADRLAAFRSDWGGVQSSSDAAGNTAGVLLADGLLRKMGAPRPYTALVAADSITAFGEATITATSLTNNGDGTATIAKTGHGLSVGDPVRTNVTASQATNVMDSSVVAVIDANTFKIALGGRTHKVTGGGAPNYILPNRRGSRGWFNWLESYLGVSLSATWCAVGGATSAQIADLLDITPQTSIADVGFVCIGMNDVYQPATAPAFAAVQASVKTLIDKVRARSALTVIIGVPPRNSADSGNWTAAKQAVHTKLNRWLHMYAQQAGAIFFDAASATQNGSTYINPAASNPDPDLSFLQNPPDYTHPSARGAQAIGFGVGALVAPFMGVKGWKPAHKSQVSTDTGNILVNADHAASTAGVSNTFAMASVTTGLVVTPTVVARTVQNDGDVVGNNQVITANYGTASGLGLFSWKRAAIQSLLTAGSTVQWKIPFSVANAIDLQALEITINGTVSGSTTWTVYGCGLDGNTKGIPGSYSGYLITPPAVVPAGLTNCDIWVRGIIGSLQTTDVTIKFAPHELLVLS